MWEGLGEALVTGVGSLRHLLVPSHREPGVEVGQCTGTGVMLLPRVRGEEAAVGSCLSICPQSRRILSGRVPLKCPG